MYDALQPEARLPATLASACVYRRERSDILSARAFKAAGNAPLNASDRALQRLLTSSHD